MNLWISVFKLLIMDFGYSKLTYSYVIVEEKFTGVWVVVFSCTRPCWVWGTTGRHFSTDLEINRLSVAAMLVSLCTSLTFLGGCSP